MGEQGGWVPFRTGAETGRPGVLTELAHAIQDYSGIQFIPVNLPSKRAEKAIAYIMVLACIATIIQIYPFSIFFLVLLKTLKVLLKRRAFMQVHQRVLLRCCCLRMCLLQSE